MSGLLLTPEERERFATWLEQEAAANQLLAAQMDMLAGSAMSYLARMKRDEVASFERVARILRSIETVSG